MDMIITSRIAEGYYRFGREEIEVFSHVGPLNKADTIAAFDVVDEALRSLFDKLSKLEGQTVQSWVQPYRTRLASKRKAFNVTFLGSDLIEARLCLMGGWNIASHIGGIIHLRYDHPREDHIPGRIPQPDLDTVHAVSNYLNEHHGIEKRSK